MTFTEKINSLFKHFKKKTVKSLSGSFDEDARFDKNNPYSAITSSFAIYFTDDTSITIDAFSEETGGAPNRCGHTPQSPRLRVSFWSGNKLVKEWNEKQ